MLLCTTLFSVQPQNKNTVKIILFVPGKSPRQASPQRRTSCGPLRGCSVRRNRLADRRRSPGLPGWSSEVTRVFEEVLKNRNTLEGSLGERGVQKLGLVLLCFCIYSNGSWTVKNKGWWYKNILNWSFCKRDRVFGCIVC